MPDQLSFDTNSELTDYNKPIFGLVGSYTLAPGVSVPYLSVNLDIERAVTELKTYDQMAPNIDTVWSLEELYQREIDYDRIDEKLVNGYLRDPNKIKFFNAITVLLFPKQGADEADGFKDYRGNDPAIPAEGTPFDANFANAKKMVFGGVQYSSMNDLLGRIRWDRCKVDAIAVDGQHRLCALRKWYESKNGALESWERNTKIPVLFVLTHAKAGFRHRAEGRALRAIAREIFTDLNKNAKGVDEARELVLDDRSISARCTRALLNGATCKDDDRLIPLSMVRWQDPNPRFDQGHFVNSILNMKQLVEIALELKEISDPLDRDKVEAFIESLDSSVGGPDKELKHGTVSLRDYYRNNYIDKESEDAHRPFLHLPDNFLGEALRRFELDHAPYLLHLLLKLRPYESLMLYARENGLVDGFFAKWQAQPEGFKRSLRPSLEKEKGLHWEQERIDKHVKLIELMKGKGESENWAFKVVFQKALARIARMLAFEYPHEKGRIGTILSFVDFMNQIYDKGLLRVRTELKDHDQPLWTYIGLTPVNQNIKVNKVVEKHIRALITLMYYANRKYITDLAEGREPTTDPRKLVRYFKSDVSGGERPANLWPLCNKHTEELLMNFEKHAHLWNRLPADPEKAKAKRRQAAKQRLAAILAEGCIVFQPVSDATEDADED